ncbi:hypothetical protein T484DRAFT_1770602 [Baffinella frigidus]|nr:hypothetical protein T484DRAFT_1770602 [Cryptophyta sp. CCMP2293]
MGRRAWWRRGGHLTFPGGAQESHAAFLEHALLDAPGGGVTLVIPREVEAAVFETFPADVWPFSARLGQYDARTPGVVLVAAHGSQIPARELPGLRASLPSLRFATYPGGHFWALEDPEAFSKCILPLILGDVSALEDMAGAGDPSPAGKAKGSSHRAVASK